MSRFNEAGTPELRLAVATLIAVLALGCAAATPASDEPLDPVAIGSAGSEPSVEGKPAGESAHAVAPARSAKTPRSLFRCWQGGRMIFEGRGYGPLPQSQVTADLKPADGAAGRVQVLDMYEALCVLELPK
jgi:hypothetical protein